MMAKESRYFYSEIKSIKEFNKLTEIQHFSKVPEDWHVIITDVKNSTQAIEKGMYKTVNTVGALAIVAILNLTTEYKIPFIFGGDGATILIPPNLLEDAKSVLLDTAETAKDGFSLDLRIGIVPVKYIYDKGVNLLLAKYEVSKNYYQAIGAGGGLTFAEELVKGEKFNIVKSLSGVKADFGGFECRWKDVPSPKEETISLIVAAISDNQDIVYSEVLEKIDEIYGKNQTRNPIKSSNLSLSMGRELMAEGMVFNKGMMFVMFAYIKLIFSNIFQMMLAKASLLGFKTIIEKNVDYQKFDDTLKMVITGDKQNRVDLDEYLNQLYKDEKIFYGIHKSEAALMTCLVFQKNGEQVHFVDSANGGYALAAKKLKQQKKERYNPRVFIQKEKDHKKILEFYKSMLNSVPLPYIGSDNSGKILIYNKTAEKVFGYHEDEIEKINMRDLYLDKTNYENFKERVIKDGKIDNYQAILISKSNKKIKVKIDALGIYEDNLVTGSMISFEII